MAAKWIVDRNHNVVEIDDEKIFNNKEEAMIARKKQAIEMIDWWTYQISKEGYDSIKNLYKGWIADCVNVLKEYQLPTPDGDGLEK